MVILERFRNMPKGVVILFLFIFRKQAEYYPTSIRLRCYNKESLLLNHSNVLVSYLSIKCAQMLTSSQLNLAETKKVMKKLKPKTGNAQQVRKYSTVYIHF